MLSSANPKFFPHPSRPTKPILHHLPLSIVTAITYISRGGYENRVMLNPTSLRASCSSSAQTCVGSCSGYGTRSNCPPLIVIAVRSAGVNPVPVKRSTR